MKKLLTLLHVLFVFVMMPCLARADISVTLTLDRHKASLMDSIRMVVTVSGTSKSNSRPILHNVESFDINRGGTSSRVEIVNGKVNAGIDYTYYLQPKKTGTFKIGPAEVKIEGQSFRSKAETLNIIAPPRTSGKNRGPLFLSASISKHSAYVEEQVTYTLKLFRLSPVSDISLDLPETANLEFRQLGKPVEYEGIYNAQSYQILEIRYALIPSATGTYGIRPSRMRLTVAQPGRQSPGGLFNDPFFNNPFFSMSSGRPMTLDSEPLELTVLPLPEKGRPADFSGLVGSFTMKANLVPSEIKAGESATLTIVLSGQGNIKRIPDLKMPELEQTKVYADQPLLKERMDDKGIGGSKTMKWALVPEKEGLQRIPSLALSFFDTTTNEYRTIKTPPFSLSVLPGKSAQAQTATGLQKRQESAGSSKKAIKQLGHDILPIHTSIKNLAGGSRSPAMGLFFWVVLIVPIFAYAAMLLGLRLIKHSSKTMAATKAKKAARTLFRKCRQENVNAVDLNSFIRDYLNNRLSLSLGSLTPTDAVEILTAKGVGLETAQKVGRLIQEIEDIVYTGQGHNPCDLGEDVVKLFRQVEKEIR